MRIAGLAACLLAFVPLTAHANKGKDAAVDGSWDLGLEAQQYLAGTIPTLRLRGQLADHLAVMIHAGLNVTYRRDLGEQDDERGIGVGGAVAIRYYPLAADTKLHLGVRLDLYYLPITFDTPVGQGDTDTVVLQPTAQVGWTFALGDRWLLEPTVSFGREINIVEDGPSVGEDYIGLLGLAVAYRL